MNNNVEFEEGEIGDLSDFEEGSQIDTRSQPLTPIEADIDPQTLVNENIDLRGPNLMQNRRYPSPKHKSFGRGDYNDGISDDNQFTRASKRPDSLLQLLSDDEGGIIAKLKGPKKKKKKRDWNPPAARHSKIKREKAPCRFYIEGRCHKGTDCPFSHEFAQSKKQELCKFYATGSCSKGNSCSFLHGEFPCKFFHLSRNCYHGDTCKFSHRPLTPASKILLDRFMNEKSSNPITAENSFPDRENAINKGLCHQPQPQSVMGEPYGDIDYRRLTFPSQSPPIRGSMCPPQSGISRGFHPRLPFDYGPNPQLRGYPPLRFPPNPNFSMSLLPNRLAAYQEMPNRPLIPLMNGLPFRFRQPPPNQNGGFHSNSRSPSSDADVFDELHNLSTTEEACSAYPLPSPSLNVNVPTSHENAVFETSANPVEVLSSKFAEEIQHSVQNLTVQQDFVLPIQQAEDPEPSSRQTPSKWFLLPLEVEAKPSYASSMVKTINCIPNDPRLLPKLPVDPRLKTGSIRGPTAPVNPNSSDEPGKPGSTTIVENNASVPAKPAAFTGGKRRTKLQLNELANNFVSGSGSGSKEPDSAFPTTLNPLTTERPYLLDPRLKRRRIVAPPQKSADDVKPPVLESPGASMQIVLQGPSA